MELVGEGGVVASSPIASASSAAVVLCGLRVVEEEQQHDADVVVYGCMVAVILSISLQSLLVENLGVCR